MHLEIYSWNEIGWNDICCHNPELCFFFCVKFYECKLNVIYVVTFSSHRLNGQYQKQQQQQQQQQLQQQNNETFFPYVPW